MAPPHQAMSKSAQYSQNTGCIYKYKIVININESTLHNNNVNKDRTTLIAVNIEIKLNWAIIEDSEW